MSFSTRTEWLISAVLAGTLGLGSFGMPAQAAPALSASAARTLTGAAAWESLLGNTVTGTTPDGPYDEFYAPDGTVIHVDRDGRDLGRWTLKGPLVCFSFPSDPEDTECRQTETSGSRGAFIEQNGIRYPFEILPGNPRHL